MLKMMDYLPAGLPQQPPSNGVRPRNASLLRSGSGQMKGTVWMCSNNAMLVSGIIEED